MISKTLAEKILLRACGSGADFVELFAERSHMSVMNLSSKKIDAVSDNTLYGAGIRAFFGTKTVFSSTSDMSEKGLMRCAENVAEAAGEKNAPRSLRLTERINGNVHPTRKVPSIAMLEEKAEILGRACNAASGFSKSIISAEGMLFDSERNILIANTDGLYTSDRSVRTRIAVEATASDGTENQSGTDSPGALAGFEFFDTIKPEEVGINAARQAVVNLEAGYCPAGKMTVAIENGFGGVIFHEACGHSLEATSVGTGTSQMAGMLGQKIANEKVTAIDDGTIPNAWGSFNIDDEGNFSRRNVLIENGVLKNYMIDRLGSRRLNMPVTGNSRRQNYTFEPTSRMSNTFIDNGPDKNEDIIASIEHGLYAKQMGGGSVNPLTGDFNFAVREGYIINHGKICEAVRGASLIGNGLQILKDIDMVGQNLDYGQGMCGSVSGSVPTNVGQPLIRVRLITVGGR